MSMAVTVYVRLKTRRKRRRRKPKFNRRWQTDRWKRNLNKQLQITVITLK